MAEVLKGRYRDGLWNRFLVANLTTRMAIPLTRLLLALRLTPNIVSWSSLWVSIAGAAYITLGQAAWHPILGAALFAFGLLLDHSDGQMARALDVRSETGGLLDSLIDRWVEALWVGSLGVGLVLQPGPNGVLGLPTGALVAIGMLAVFGTFYARYSVVVKILTLARKEIRRSGSLSAAPDTSVPRGRPRFLGLPVQFSRDVLMWLLFGITLSPAWDAGLLLVGGLLCLRGLELNLYTARALQKPTNVLAGLSDPDSH
jgi:phosphatidylglycerophosphate synthase